MPIGTASVVSVRGTSGSPVSSLRRRTIAPASSRHSRETLVTWGSTLRRSRRCAVPFSGVPIMCSTTQKSASNFARPPW